MELEDIGEMFDLTRERARQIKDKAVAKFRGATAGRILKPTIPKDYKWNIDSPKSQTFNSSASQHAAILPPNRPLKNQFIPQPKKRATKQLTQEKHTQVAHKKSDFHNPVKQTLSHTTTEITKVFMKEYIDDQIYEFPFAETLHFLQPFCRSRLCQEPIVL